MSSFPQQLLSLLQQQGYALVDLAAEPASCMIASVANADRFFAQDVGYKRRFEHGGHQGDGFTEALLHESYNLAAGLPSVSNRTPIEFQPVADMVSYILDDIAQQFVRSVCGDEELGLASPYALFPALDCHPWPPKRVPASSLEATCTAPAAATGGPASSRTAAVRELGFVAAIYSTSSSIQVQAPCGKWTEVAMQPSQVALLPGLCLWHCSGGLVPAPHFCQGPGVRTMFVYHLRGRPTARVDCSGILPAKIAACLPPSFLGLRTVQQLEGQLQAALGGGLPSPRGPLELPQSSSEVSNSSATTYTSTTSATTAADAASPSPGPPDPKQYLQQQQEAPRTASQTQSACNPHPLPQARFPASGEVQAPEQEEGGSTRPQDPSTGWSGGQEAGPAHTLSPCWEPAAPAPPPPPAPPAPPPPPAPPAPPPPPSSHSSGSSTDDSAPATRPSTATTATTATVSSSSSGAMPEGLAGDAPPPPPPPQLLDSGDISLDGLMTHSAAASARGSRASASSSSSMRSSAPELGSPTCTSLDPTSRPHSAASSSLGQASAASASSGSLLDQLQQQLRGRGASSFLDSCDLLSTPPSPQAPSSAMSSALFLPMPLLPPASPSAHQRSMDSVALAAASTSTSLHEPAPTPAPSTAPAPPARTSTSFPTPSPAGQAPSAMPPPAAPPALPTPPPATHKFDSLIDAQISALTAKLDATAKELTSLLDFHPTFPSPPRSIPTPPPQAFTPPSAPTYTPPTYPAPLMAHSFSASSAAATFLMPDAPQPPPQPPLLPAPTPTTPSMSARLRANRPPGQATPRAARTPRRATAAALLDLHPDELDALLAVHRRATANPFHFFAQAPPQQAPPTSHAPPAPSHMYPYAPPQPHNPFSTHGPPYPNPFSSTSNPLYAPPPEPYPPTLQHPFPQYDPHPHHAAALPTASNPIHPPSQFAAPVAPAPVPPPSARSRHDPYALLNYHNPPLSAQDAAPPALHAPGPQASARQRPSHQQLLPPSAAGKPHWQPHAAQPGSPAASSDSSATSSDEIPDLNALFQLPPIPPPPQPPRESTSRGSSKSSRWGLRLFSAPSRSPPPLPASPPREKYALYTNYAARVLPSDLTPMKLHDLHLRGQQPVSLQTPRHRQPAPRFRGVAKTHAAPRRSSTYAPYASGRTSHTFAPYVQTVGTPRASYATLPMPVARSSSSLLGSLKQWRRKVKERRSRRSSDELSSGLLTPMASAHRRAGGGVAACCQRTHSMSSFALQGSREALLVPPPRTLSASSAASGGSAAGKTNGLLARRSVTSILVPGAAVRPGRSQRVNAERRQAGSQQPCSTPTHRQSRGSIPATVDHSQAAKAADPDSRMEQWLRDADDITSAPLYGRKKADAPPQRPVTAHGWTHHHRR